MTENEEFQIIQDPDWKAKPTWSAVGQSGRALFLNENDETRKICYDVFYGDEDKPNVMFLPYLLTPKNQGIAASLEAFCRKENLTYLCADYFGVSRSGGTTEDGCLSRWIDDSIELLDSVTKGKTVLVGAAVGAWIMMRIAMKRPDLVGGLVGMSIDADFTEELLWPNLAKDDKAAIMEQGAKDILWGKTIYRISRKLIEDGRENLILQGGKDSLDITCPVRLIHAFNDEEVPYANAVRTLEAIKARDVRLTLLKDATHYMEEEAEHSAMHAAVAQVVKASARFEYDLTSPGSG